MPIVTETLLGLLRKQVKNHGTLVWYDPDQRYHELACELTPEQVGGATIFRYAPEQGFFWLRHAVEAQWGGAVDPPRLILYVPLAQSETEHALIEFEQGGVVVKPGQQPQERNTDLAFIARQALEKILPPAKLERLLAEVETGRLSLAELNHQAERTLDEQIGVLKVVFETGNPMEIALRFVSDPQIDTTIEARGAQHSLATLLTDLLGTPLKAGTLEELRAVLARQILLTDLITGIGAEIPLPLESFPIAANPVARETAVALAQSWRNRHDRVESYCRWAHKIEKGTNLGLGSLSRNALAQIETFAGVETALQTTLEQDLQQRPMPTHLALAEERRDTGFWPRQDPQLKTRWEVIVDAAAVRLEGIRIQHALKGKDWSAERLFAHYAYENDGNPWCTLEAAHRHLERDTRRFDLDLEAHASLHKLVVKARQAYAEAANELAQAFLKAYQRAGFALPGVQLQADIYKDHVAPLLLEKRVAYLWVDALRFEMARELCAFLQEGWEKALIPALATPPTITEIGMSALVPGAEQGMTLVEAGGKLALALKEVVLKSRADRVAYVQKVLGEDTVVTKLEELISPSDPHLPQALKKAPAVLVTATEGIDGLCENNPTLARRMLDDIFAQIRRGIQALFGYGIQCVVVTADHGYLFGNEIAPGEHIDAPGGHTVALKRRVWVGKGGASSESYLRTPISAFGIGGDYELATPWNLSCFKVAGGATEYFHGGLSLPELVIPVLTVYPDGAGTPTPNAAIQWELTPGSPTLSTRFATVRVGGHALQLLPVVPPLVRAEIRAGGHVCSVPVAASYGFNEVTKDVQLAIAEGESNTLIENTITLMITEEAKSQEVSIYLLDANTGLTLAKLDGIPLSITL